MLSTEQQHAHIAPVVVVVSFLDGVPDGGGITLGPGALALQLHVGAPHQLGPVQPPLLLRPLRVQAQPIPRVLRMVSDASGHSGITH